VVMQPITTYSSRTSTPCAAFFFRIRRMESQSSPGAMMKYSRKI